jgi:hypothetical protein
MTRWRDPTAFYLRTALSCWCPSSAVIVPAKRTIVASCREEPFPRLDGFHMLVVPRFVSDRPVVSVDLLHVESLPERRKIQERPTPRSPSQYETVLRSALIESALQPDRRRDPLVLSFPCPAALADTRRLFGTSRGRLQFSSEGSYGVALFPYAAPPAHSPGPHLAPEKLGTGRAAAAASVSAMPLLPISSISQFISLISRTCASMMPSANSRTRRSSI